MARRIVDVGGAGLDSVVEGRGAVGVVFENGLATPLEFWDAVVPAIAERARTLRYDRRWATPNGALAPRSPAGILADLKTLLARLAFAPPYVFVGHSWGGVIARLFAHTDPDDVAGLVFVDATNGALGDRTLSVLPAVNAVMSFLGRAPFVRRGFIRQVCPDGSPPAYRARVEERLLQRDGWEVALRTTRSESAAIPSALALLRHECADLPAVPVQVLTAGRVKNTSARRVHDTWKDMAERAPDAQYTEVATSGHYMPIDAPDVVIRAIVAVLDSVRPR